MVLFSLYGVPGWNWLWSIGIWGMCDCPKPLPPQSSRMRLYSLVLADISIFASLISYSIYVGFFGQSIDGYYVYTASNTPHVGHSPFSWLLTGTALSNNSFLVMADNHTCEFCHESFNKHGIGSHRKKCERAYNNVIRDLSYRVQPSRAQGAILFSWGSHCFLIFSARSYVRGNIKPSLDATWPGAIAAFITKR